MADPTDSLMREVDDAVRHDRMVALWQRYRLPLLAAALALVVATAGMGMWKRHQEQRAGEAMQQFAIAQAQFEAGDFATAADSFAMLGDLANAGELQDLALLWEGRALEQGGKRKQALARYTSLADKPRGGDPVWRDLACLRLAGLAAAKAAPCLKAGASPLKGERDLLRAAQLWQDGKAAEAAKLLDALAADPKQDQAVRTRAQHYRSAVATDADA